MVEGYVPVPDDLVVDRSAQDEIEVHLRLLLTSGGELDGVDWELISVTGEAATELIRVAESREAACVVVGKRHKGFAEFVHRLASGSVSRAVMASSKFPVLVVP